MKRDCQRKWNCHRSLVSNILQVCILLSCIAPGQANAIDLDFLIDTDPELVVPQPVARFNPALKPLWILALQRPEIDMQRMAAETIARAHEAGMPDLIETVPSLEKILLAESSHPAARFAAARALIVLDSRNSSQQLFQASQAFGSDLRQLIEPSLAAWHYSPAGQIWLKRLESPDTTRRDLILAIRGLALLREQSSLSSLIAMAKDLARQPDLRLEAATAIGTISEGGLEPDAERLARDTRTPQFVNQLCAIQLLAQHSSTSAQQLLIELATHSEPAVAVAALQRLNSIDSKLVIPLAASAMKNPDARVRLEGARACLKSPNTELVSPLIQLLADPHPGVRREVCDGLNSVAKQPEFTDPIHQGAMQVLVGDSWQGQEQAALLLGMGDYKPASARLVELLESPRDEVLITSAWSLRQLAMPDTVPAMIDKAKRQTELRKTGVANDSAVSVQIILLFEALGVLKAADAMPVLMEYVPKQQLLGERTRGAAIWAIGVIHEGTRSPAIEEAFSERIQDFNDLTPESLFVKEMCMIAVARMNAVDHAPMLRDLVPQFASPPRLASAVRWSIRKLTGEELPPAKPPMVRKLEWFLEPLSEAAEIP
jgi:HEAT repeat protein